MPKLLAVEKKIFFFNIPGYFLNTIIQPVGRTSSRGNTACRFVCSRHWDSTKRRHLSLFTVPVKIKVGVFRFGRGQIFCMEMKSSSLYQCVWILVSGLQQAKITLWASTNAPSSQARATSQKSPRCNKEATVFAFYSSGQNESRSFQLQSLSFNTQNWETKALNSSAHCGEES